MDGYDYENFRALTLDEKLSTLIFINSTIEIPLIFPTTELLHL